MSLAEAECHIGEADRGLAAAAAELARRQAAIEQARDARDGRQAAALALRRPGRASCAPRWRASALRAPRSGGRGAAGGGAARDGARGGRDAARGARRGRGQRGGGGGGQGARRGAAAARRRARRPARSVGATRRRPRARRRPCTPLPRQRSAWPRASWPTCGRPPRPSCRPSAPSVRSGCWPSAGTCKLARTFAERCARGRARSFLRRLGALRQAPRLRRAAALRGGLAARRAGLVPPERRPRARAVAAALRCPPGAPPVAAAQRALLRRWLDAAHRQGAAAAASAHLSVRRAASLLRLADISSSMAVGIVPLTGSADMGESWASSEEETRVGRHVSGRCGLLLEGARARAQGKVR